MKTPTHPHTHTHSTVNTDGQTGTQITSLAVSMTAQMLGVSEVIMPNLHAGHGLSALAIGDFINRLSSTELTNVARYGHD